jgi:NAD(P)-dependent dehydrogenase (short-subunit alcohol dehydrogenase family)
MTTKKNHPQSVPGRLAGRVAWISGAASGIGESVAELFAREGARVAVVDHRLEAARKVAARINGLTPGAAVALAADVSKESDVKRAIAATVKRFGRLDILVNNAGIVEIGDLHTYTEAQWDRVMDVNVKSMFFAFKHAFPHLRTARRGYVVNLGSISSFVGQARTPVYTTTKHAILGLTRSIALDYAASGVRCNCICPGITETPMLWEHLNVRPDPQAALAERLQRVPMGVSLSPLDVAKSVLYFSCEDSAGVTGTSLTIDCGYLTAAEWQCTGPTFFQEKAQPRLSF